MKVYEFIEYLKKVNPNADVIMAKDAEGNSFSPFSGDHSEGLYVPKNTWSGNYYSYEDAENDEEAQEEGVDAVVLWPTN